MSAQRKQLYIDSAVQGAIIRRVISYWCVTLVFITVPILNVMTIMDPSKFLYEHIGPLLVRFWPMYLAMGVLLPLLVRDVLKFSNRFCGPVYRIAKEVNEWSDGREYRPIQLREDDYWIGVVNAINRYAEGRQEASFPEARSEERIERSQDHSASDSGHGAGELASV